MEIAVEGNLARIDFGVADDTAATRGDTAASNVPFKPKKAPSTSDAASSAAAGH